MSFETKHYALSDIIEIIGGGTPKRSVEEYWNGDIPWLSVVDFNSGSRFVDDTTEKITELGLQKSSTKLLEKGQLIISARGTVGCLAQLRKPMAFNQSCYGLSGIEGLVENDFLYYLVKQKVDNLKQITHGAVFDTITRDTFKHIEVDIPSEKNVRTSIAKILGDLDDKIALNTQINQTLEAMAQALFKSWFVDFDPVKAKMEARASGGSDDAVRRAAMAVISGKSDEELVQFEQENPEAFGQLAATADLFPDALVESELGLIPEGWVVKCIYDTAEYVNGGAFKASDFTSDNSGLPIIKIAELKQGISQGTKYTTKKVASKYYIKNDDVLYSWSGSPETSLEVFKWFGGDGILNQHIFKLNFGSDSQKHYAYYLLKELKPLLIATAKQKQTTGLGHVTVADMKRIKVAYPDSELLDSFSDHIYATYERCSSNEKENSRLVETRDTLLPKLLFGEIDLSSFGDRGVGE